MKKSSVLILFLGLFCNSFLQAQTIEYSIISDYSTLISNIFGIQCEGVSNVQVTGSSLAIGRFENGQAFGLHSGLALSTGELSGSNQASNVLYSSVLDTGSDNDIAAYGSLSSNFDAASITFDFTPSVSDSISFTYLLASEEYPEFANMTFSDRFLFLVSENGSAFTNIAYIPGTTTPVEINTINDAVNPQYYVDNLTGPNASTFVFDGYTIPLTAAFYAQVGAVYHIKLVIADLGDASFDSAIFLDEQDAYSSISGSVSVNNVPAEGLLEVFNVIQDTTIAVPIQSLTITNGLFNSDSLSTGMYHIRFTPDPILFPSTPPVYFTSGSDWTTATAIGLPCFLNTAGLNSDSLDVLNGTGSISGLVSIDTSFLKAISEPFHNAWVYLHHQTTNELIAFTQTDINGIFQFNQVPSGNYYIRLDVPYIPQVNNHSIQLLDGQQVLGADFEILTDGIHALNNTYLNIEENNNAHLVVYPNPTKHAFKVTSQIETSYSISSINGQILMNGTAAKGTTNIQIDQLTNGLYLVTFGNGDTIRLIKE